MKRMVLKSKVDADGVLRVSVPVGEAAAEREVQLTVEPLGAAAQFQQDYQSFLRATAGAWQGEFVRPAPWHYEVRDPL